MNIIKQVIWCCIALAILQIALVILKLTKVLAWEWWLILIPAMVILVALAIVGIAIYFLIDKIRKAGKKVKLSKYDRASAKRKNR